MANIRISATFARWVLETSTSLVNHVYGQNYDPALGEFEMRDLGAAPSIYDNLPPDDVELRYWVNTVIRFAKTLAGIFRHELTLLENIEVLPFLVDTDNNENSI